MTTQLEWQHEFDATTEDLHSCLDLFAEWISSNDLEPRAQTSLSVVMDEVLSNVVNYGYPDDTSGTVRVTLSNDPAVFFTLHFEDDGEAFNPLYQSAPKQSDASAITPGGLGIFMIRRLAASLRYQRLDDKNHLVVRIPARSASS